MHVHYKFGLFLIFLLSVSRSYGKALVTSTETNADYERYDEYEDYYDEEEHKASSTAAPLTTTKSSPTKVLIEEFLDTALSGTNQVTTLQQDASQSNSGPPQCPTECTCRDENRHISCSGMDLNHVPKNIPGTALTLDLSNNRIRELPPETFSTNSNLKEINLSKNLLTSIGKEVFSDMTRLDRLSLDSNNLTEISPETFSDAYELSSLSLNNNPIVLPKDGSFLHQPALNELFLRNCSLTEIYDETFTNLSSLKTLKMDGNFFSKKINTKAFEPLKDLIKLKLPELEQENVEELCNVLKSIDNISLKRFDISCYELVNGNSFNESLILSTEAPPSKSELPGDAPKHTNRTTIIQAAKHQASDSQSSVVVASILPAGMTYTNTTDTNNVEAASNETSVGLTTTASSDKAYQVPVSPETIHYSLISIIIIAVIGLIIGFICRKDIYGIKTKCCRTRKPPPGDQVRPAEEIPLNKIG